MATSASVTSYTPTHRWLPASRIAPAIRVARSAGEWPATAIAATASTSSSGVTAETVAGQPVDGVANFPGDRYGGRRPASRRHVEPDAAQERDTGADGGPPRLPSIEEGGAAGGGRDR